MDIIQMNGLVCGMHVHVMITSGQQRAISSYSGADGKNKVINLML